MDTAKMRVVTIIATAELSERLERDILQLGARGMTIARVDGHGAHGAHRASFLDRGNVRIETIVDHKVADRLLEHVVKHYDGLEIVAFAYDVQAVPKSRFE
jgi:nitrogen regulatory protein PII